MQILSRRVGGKHDDIVDVRAVDVQPADRVRIVGRDRAHLLDGLRAGRVVRGSERLGDGSVTAVAVPVPAEHTGTDQKADDADGADHNENGFFHTKLLIKNGQCHLTLPILTA